MKFTLAVVVAVDPAATDLFADHAPLVERHRAMLLIHFFTTFQTKDMGTSRTNNNFAT